MEHRDWKKRLVDESKEFLAVALLLTPFFLSFSSYRMLLLGNFREAHFSYGEALVNALMLSKLILLGEHARLGRGSENGPLIFSTLDKSFLFTALYICFHSAEVVVHSLLEGKRLSGALHEAIVIQSGDLLGRALVVFFAFINFFALREIRRVMGVERFRQLFLGQRHASPFGEVENRV
jgi:hypothetical protein